MTDNRAMGLSLARSRQSSIAIAVAVVIAACAIDAGAASAVILHAARGVVPARGAATPASRGAATPAPATSGNGSSPSTPLRSLPVGATPALLYHGGPVMHSSRVYTIFWQPSPLPSKVSAFQASPSYQTTVNDYFQGVAHDDGLLGNVFSVATQYYDLSGPAGARSYIDYAVQHESTDTYTDPEKFPPNSCTDKSDLNEAESLPVCLSAEQLATEIAKVIVSQGWTAGGSSIFLLYTPPGVGSCFKAGESSTVVTDSCAYTGEHGYCAYHSYFAATGLPEVIFANLPYGATPNCDNQARPAGGSSAGPVIDSGSHEHIEALTDPTELGWWDSEGSEATNADYGQEIADLCVSSSWESQYGGLLAGSTGYGTENAFNQLISSTHYLLQREWNNAASATQGACAQRLVPAAFTLPVGARVARQASFDGSASGTAEDPVVSWSWDFGDGFSGSGSTAPHIYAAAGEYTVTLTVADAYGNSHTAVHQVSVAPAEEETGTPTIHPGGKETASGPLPTPSPIPGSTATPPARLSPARLSSAQLARALGLPPGGTALAGLGTITLGHASCPLACSLTVGLYFTVHTTRHGRLLSSRRLVGSALISTTSGASKPIAVKLNALGRALLRANRRLTVRLVVSVTDGQGVIRRLASSLTLTWARGRSSPQ
jgi:hypothetical protein